jgi:hypothetical protein
MGYDIHITRKSERFDEAGPEITLEEWEPYAESGPMLSVEGHVDWRVRSSGWSNWSQFVVVGGFGQRGGGQTDIKRANLSVPIL